MLPLHQARRALAVLRWSQRGLAEILNCDDRLVRRWISGEVAIPADVADWLLDLAELHTSLPPPAAWRRRATGSKAEGGVSMPVNQDIELSSVSWDWHPVGNVVAKGTMTVGRSATEQPPITLHFEIPMANLPPRAVLADPQAWVLTRLRQALYSPRPAKSEAGSGQLQSSPTQL
jgi:hypothetical protein